MYHIVKMPKGALLHAHVGAVVEVPTLLKMGLKQRAVHVRVSKTLSQASIRTVLPEFRALPEDDFTDFESLTSQTYVPGTWVQISRARDSFSADLGGTCGFDNWVVQSMMISPREAYHTHSSVKKVAGELTEHAHSISDTVHPLTRYGKSSKAPSG